MDLLPQYRRCNDLDGLKLSRAMFGVVPNWHDSPMRPITSRLLHVGDSAGNRSALSFAGTYTLLKILGASMQAVGYVAVSWLTPPSSCRFWSDGQACEALAAGPGGGIGSGPDRCIFSAAVAAPLTSHLPHSCHAVFHGHSARQASTEPLFLRLGEGVHRSCRSITRSDYLATAHDRAERQ